MAMRIWSRAPLADRMAHSRGQGYGYVGATVGALRGARVLRGEGARRGEGACAHEKVTCEIFPTTAPYLHAIDFFPAKKNDN